MTKRVFFYGIIFMIPVAVIFRANLDFTVLRRPNLLGNFLFLGILASAICYVTWNRAVDILGPVKTTVYIYLQPIITVIASIIILKETITPLAVLGMVFTLCGLVISQMNAGKKRKS